MMRTELGLRSVPVAAWLRYLICHSCKPLKMLYPSRSLLLNRWTSSGLGPVVAVCPQNSPAYIRRKLLNRVLVARSPVRIHRRTERQTSWR
jgi:hypothetical protein